MLSLEEVRNPLDATFPRGDQYGPLQPKMYWQTLVFDKPFAQCQRTLDCRKPSFLPGIISHGGIFLAILCNWQRAYL